MSDCEPLSPHAHTPDQSPPCRRRNRIGCLCLAVLTVLVGVIYQRSLVSAARQDLDRELARLTAAGVLRPPEDLIPTIPPGEQNAADLYLAAAASMYISEKETAAVYDLPDYDPQRLQVLRTVIARNQTYFSLIDQAARLQYCAFPVDWYDPFPPFAQHAQTRVITRWLGFRAELRIAEGDLDGALDSIGTSFRLGNHLAAEPSVTSQLVAWALQSIVRYTLDDALAAGDPSPTACRQFFDTLSDLDYVRDSVRAFRGQVVLSGLPLFDSFPEDLRQSGIFSTQRMRENGPLQDEFVLRSYGSIGEHLLYRDEITYLRRMAKVIGAAQLPWPQCRQEMEAAYTLTHTAPARHSTFTRFEDDPGFLYGDMLALRDTRAADARLAQVAVALKDFHRDHGRYPPSVAPLEQAGWKLPPDPFTGQPFRYRREGVGFLLWSLGPNLADDGATPYTEDMSRDDGPYDVVLSCPR